MSSSGSRDLTTSYVFTSPAALAARNLSESFDLIAKADKKQPSANRRAKAGGAFRDPTKKIPSHQSPLSSVKETKEKKCFMCRAYRAAYKKSHDRGYDEASSRASAQKAYKAAGHQYVSYN